MQIIKTPDKNPLSEGAPLYISAIDSEGRPSYTARKMMAAQFTDEQAEELLPILHQNFGKPFSTEQA